MKWLHFGKSFFVVLLFIFVMAFLSTEIIMRYATFHLSDWNRTFLICVLVYWLMLDNYTFATDLHAALISYRRLSDEIVISEHRIHALNTGAVFDKPNQDTSLDKEKILTLELLHWNLLFAKVSVMYYIRRMRIEAQSIKPKPVVSLIRGRSRSLEPGSHKNKKLFHSASY